MPLRHVALGCGKSWARAISKVVGPRVLATRRHHHVAIELGHEVMVFQLSAVAWFHTALSSTGLQVCRFSLRLIFAAP